MAFPTIPTGNRILAATAASTAATRTFPAFSGLTKNNGDLLIAIVVGYQSTATANAVWSGWNNGFTEFGDFSSTTTCAIGMAYKWADGTESGSLTVTQASAITGHAAMILMSIPGAHATSPPEAVGAATGSDSNADPGSLNPTGWDVGDTLWIAVCGLGETSTSGAWGGITAAPSSYSSYFDTGVTGDAVGAVELAVAFRENAVASEDPGTFSNDTSNARWRAATIAVRNAPASVTGAIVTAITGSVTTVAKINAKAQVATTFSAAVTTAGNVVYPALVEGMDYYRRGEILPAQQDPDGTRVGFDNFRRGEVLPYLVKFKEVPAGPQTHYGITQTNLTVATVTQAKITAKSQTTLTETVGIVTQGSRTCLGQVTFSETVSVVTQGSRTRTGQTTLTETVTTTTQGTRTGLAQTTLTETVSIVTSGTSTDNRRRGEVSWASFEVPSIVFINGATVLDLTDSITTNGVKTAVGQTTLAESVGIVTSALVTAKSSSTFTETVGVVTSAKVTAKSNTTLAEVVSTITSGTSSVGAQDWFGQTTLGLTVSTTTGGTKTAVGQVTIGLTDSVSTSGSRTRLGQTTLEESVSVITSGQSVLKGQTTLTETVSTVTSGSRTRFGNTTLTETVSFVTSGTSSTGAQTWYGQTVLSLTDSVTSSGLRTRFGQTTLALTDSIVTVGTRTRLGQTTLTETVSFVTSGIRTRFGQTTLTETASFVTSGTATDNRRRGRVSWAAFQVDAAPPKMGATVLALTGSITTSGTSSDNRRRGRVSWAQFAVGVTGLTQTGQTTLTETVSTVTQGSVSQRQLVPKIAAAGLIWLFGDYDPVKSHVSLTDSITTTGKITAYGRTSLDLTAGVITRMPLVLVVGITTQGNRIFYGVAQTLDIHVEVVTGSTTVPSVGSASLTEVVDIVTSGVPTHFGSTSLTETAGITTVAGTFHGSVSFTNVNAIVTTATGRVTAKSSVSVVEDANIVAIASIGTYGSLVLNLDLYLHTFAQGTIFLTGAICSDLSLIVDECDDLSLNGASDSELVLVGADE